ncbi:MAG: guanylate kinase [Verrucomicrobia bacterium]|nr:MAG: guanylate kinase [Verrucomicrobiota bacterium]
MTPPSHNASSPAKPNWRRSGNKFKTLSNQFSRPGILFVISAPSGAGKTTLVEAIRKTPNLFYYGTLREPVLTNLQNGVDVLIDIDTQGAATIRNCDDPLIRRALADVFIMPPDLDELRRRLRNRGTETEEQINRRLDTAVREMELWRDYRYTIISGSVEEDLERFRHIMAAEGYLSRRLLCTGRC